MIDLTVDETALEAVAAHTRDRRVRIPTLAQMRDPGLIPSDVQARLVDIGLWDLHPLNLYRITWHNEPVPLGGGFGGVNYVEWPSVLTGTDARIVSVIGKWFPTGAHKVGAAFGCLVPRLVTGQFDPATQKAVWPSTGNYCRGRRVRLQPLGLRLGGHPPGGNEPRAVRVVTDGGGGDHQDPGFGVQRQGDLR